MTDLDMDYGIYPEGIYRAFHSMKALGVPIYVTENGIADAKDDRRKFWIQGHLYAVHKAIQDGIDVRGFIYWSLMDNFGKWVMQSVIRIEWAKGFGMRFGLYEVNYETQQRTLREGAKAYVDIIKNFRNNE